VFDIETSYLLVKSFQLLNKNPIPYQGIVQERNILTAAWKWRGDKEVHSSAINHKSPTNDKPVIKDLIEAINESDAVVAHYGDKFDMRYLRTRALYHGLSPPKPVTQIDTWKIARSLFLFNSNRLDYLGSYLGLGRKIKTDHTLWDGCMEGKLSAIRKMETYNKQDVKLLEAVFDKLIPYAPTKVNASLLEDRPCCPNCGGKLQARGYGVSLTRRYTRYQCRGCGKWSSQTSPDAVIR
jgi:DNA polymerase elongation subunit (family B)